MNTLLRSHITTLVLILASCTLVSCGGGGGAPADSPSDPPNDPPAASLSLLTSVPAPQALDVTRDAPIVLAFSSPLDATTVNATNVSLGTAEGSHAATLTVDGATLTVTPSNALAPETLYTLRVETGVRSASGATLIEPVILTFKSIGRQWQTAQLIANEEGNAEGTKLAVDSNGNAIAAWTQSSGTDSRILAARYSAQSRTWSTAQPISQEGARGRLCTVAMDAEGNAIATWSQRRDAVTTTLWGNRYDAANGTWGTAAEISVEVAPGDESSFARVLFRSNGDAHVFYTVKDIPVTRRATPSGQWEAPTPLVTAYPPEHALGTTVDAVADANGNVLAAWGTHIGNFAGHAMMFSRYQPASGWSEPQVLWQNPNAGLFAGIDIAGNARGDVAIVWDAVGETSFEVWSSRYSAADGAWSTKKVSPETEDAAFIATVAIDRLGNVAVAWEESGARDRIRANRYSIATGSWGNPHYIDTADAGLASDPRLQFDTYNTLFALWHYRPEGASTRLLVASGAPGADSWSELPSMQNSSAGISANPHLIFDRNGKGIAVWEQWDGARMNIWANTLQ